MKAKTIAFKLLAGLLLLGYGGVLLYWMFWGFGRSAHIGLDEPFRYNAEPFETIRLFTRSAGWDNLRAPLINLAGNVAVFVPFGILFPILFRKCRNYFGFILRFLLLILLLELAQGFSGAGVADVDDLILNGIGATIGYIGYRLAVGPEKKRGARAGKRTHSAAARADSRSRAAQDRRR
ncbi:VanZ family protein [Saccharibacillus alkalitolerans]|uniref:VanZ family protein n=1 Tax=Saccharibacillus alkalitolerans TaxID=2705290 RepID=A0ABX0F7V5_9BACL|nr:VanZ family protein [Saccharibacillus alkalitolerans]NGZ75663.1 VanZ family protein [Saccharibacillus alkalitolerans]